MNFFVEQWKQLVDAFKAIADRFQEMFVEAFKAIPANLMEGIKVETVITEADKWQAMLDVYKNLGVLDEAAVNNLMQMKDIAHPYDWFLYLAMQTRLLGGTIDTMSSTGLSFMQQSVNADIRPGLPNPFEIIKAAFIAPEKTGHVRNVMEKLGYKEEDIDLFFLANYQVYDIEHIRVLYLRGVLDDKLLFERMRELGFTDTRTKEIIQSWDVIPPIQDILTMVAKEAFEPDIVEEIGLDAEFPYSQSEWLTKQGLSLDWQKKYWRAHWMQPSIEQGYEMLHREDYDNPGQNIIDFEQLDMLFRIQEIPPFWRDKLTKIAYQPLTRVDIRRMHKMGVIDEQGVYRAYLDNGYNPKNALLMTEFTLRYNQGSPKRLTAKKILDAYENTVFTKEQALSMLEDLKGDKTVAEFLIAERDYSVAEKYEKQIIKNIGDRFKLNLEDEFDTRKRLGQLALPGQRVEILIDTWKIDKFENIKLASKTDLEKFYKAKVIDEDTWNMEMERLGYGFTYRKWFFHLMTGKPQPE